MPAPFVVGIARSGTTLLRLMLDSHPELTIPPETHFVPKLVSSCEGWAEEGLAPDVLRARAAEQIIAHPRWDDFGLDAGELRRRVGELGGAPDAGPILRAFYNYYAELQGKPRWGDKSPPYTWKSPRIQRALPEARFINLIRDGRDVALSLGEVSWGPGELSAAAHKWVDELSQARRRANRLYRGSYLEVRYEDLVTDAEPVLRRICEFVDLPFDAAMLTYHENAAQRMSEVQRELKPKGGGTITAAERESQHKLVSKPPSANRAGRWRTEMPESDQKEFEAIAGELLRELGYET